MNERIETSQTNTKNQPLTYENAKLMELDELRKQMQIRGMEYSGSKEKLLNELKLTSVG